ncbi:hypothetical protein J437_LFUL009508 [Ladona fulva]|uniref:Cytochrome P450 n=1 Tax=Ladona fulva TaxID=123851 RepID=A0A8K0NZ04_LADFU|nr:hypothetical protein J437_LFUL009508 [Ladona fulva]
MDIIGEGEEFTAQISIFVPQRKIISRLDMDVFNVYDFISILLALLVILAAVPAVVFLTPVFLFYVNPKGRVVSKLMKPIPGPPSLPILGNALDFLITKEKMTKYLDDCASKYLPIYKAWSFSTPLINPIGPEYVEAILHSSRNIEKSDLYGLLEPWLGSGLLTSKGQKWFSHRKILTPAFHFKILEKFVPIFVERSKKLAQQLEVETTTGGPFNVVPYISQCTLEVICESAMGIKLDKNDTRLQEYFKAIKSLGNILYYRATRPWLIMNWLFALTPTAFTQRKCLKVLHSFTDMVIKEKKREYLERRSNKELMTEETKPQKKKIRAFLDLLVELSLEENLLTDLEIREEVDTFMFEGHDTTSMAISWTLFALANNPDIQEEVREEVDLHMNRLNDIDDDDSEVSMVKMFNEMQLLERCIKESLRIYPSVPFITRTLTEDLKMGEYLIPEETKIHLHIRNIHHNPSIFPQPDKFDPDRFLPEAVRARHPYAYVPFSAGPRNCIGQRFAMLEMKAVISAIVHRYRIIAVDTPEDVSVIIDLVLRSSHGINIKLEPRH